MIYTRALIGGKRYEAEVSEGVDSLLQYLFHCSQKLKTLTVGGFVRHWRSLCYSIYMYQSSEVQNLEGVGLAHMPNHTIKSA